MSYSRLDQILRGGKKMASAKTDIPAKDDKEDNPENTKKETEEDISLEELERRQEELARRAKEEAEKDIRREQFQKRCNKLIHPSRRFNESLRQVFRLLKDPEYYDATLDKDIADIAVPPDTIARMVAKMDDCYEHLRMLREEAESCLEPDELSQKDKDYLAPV